MAKIIINNWHEGLAPQFWNDDTLVKSGTDNMYAAGVVNPFVQFGILSPGNATVGSITDAGGVITSSDFTRFALVDDDNIYSGVPSVYVGNAAKIQAIDCFNSAMVNVAEFPHIIAPTASTHNGHLAFKVRDIIPYQINGVKRLWYFYTDDVDGDGGTYDLVSSFTVDSPQEEAWGTATGGGVFNKNFDIIAEVADNGKMYVANANNIYKFDGTVTGGAKGIVTIALTFDTGLQVVDMKDGQGYLWIALLRSFKEISTLTVTSTRPIFVLAWDKQSTSQVSNSFYIDGASLIYALALFRGIPYIFIYSVRGICEFRKFNGNRFETIMELGSDGAPVNRHNVYSTDRFIMWIGRNKKIYLYGSIDPKFPDGLFQIGDFSAYSALNGLLNIYPTEFWMAGDSGVTKKIFLWNPFSSTGLCLAGNYKSKVYELPKLSVIKSITLYWKSFLTGGNHYLTLETYINNSGSAKDSITINYQKIPTGEGSRGYKYIPLGGSKYENVNYFQIGLIWSTAETISKSIKPIRIEIEYEEKTKKK